MTMGNVDRAGDRPPQVERSASRGICEQCREPFRGRKDKRFCSDACRTKFGREHKDSQVRDFMAWVLSLAATAATARTSASRGPGRPE